MHLDCLSSLCSFCETTPHVDDTAPHIIIDAASQVVDDAHIIDDTTSQVIDMTLDDEGGTRHGPHLMASGKCEKSM